MTKYVEMNNVRSFGVLWLRDRYRFYLMTSKAVEIASKTNLEILD